jgi:hypothetical protein
MDPGHPLLREQSLTLTPSGHGRGYAVAVANGSGATLATCDADGAVRDHAGALLLTAPVRRHGRRDQPLRLAVEVADAWGRPLGGGRVAKYGLGPRARKATVAIVDPQENVLAQLEPRDHRGDQLAVAADGGDLATVAVTEVKTGFLRKSRHYGVSLSAAIPPAARPLVLAVLIRYDALLDAVVAASMRDT